MTCHDADRRSHRLARWPALAATLILPVFLLHGRALAEIMIAVVDVAFLADATMHRRWAWLHTPWLRLGLVWWTWLVLCSVLASRPSALQAIATVRFLVFLAALEWFVLAPPTHRRWLQMVVIAGALYIVLQTLLQFATGHNLYGDPRSGDGELTGPFDKPRAAAPLSRLLFPALLPPVAALFVAGRRAKIAAAALAVAATGVVVLIGQRMPLLLTGLGLVTTGLFMKRLRLLLLAAAVAAVALVGASVVVSPPTFYRLVTKFSFQMENFKASPYGLILARALTIAEDDPWTGRGFDGFRTGCPEPRYFRGWGNQGDGGGASFCVQHPHNHFLQAMTDAGVPGLVLFSLLVVAWLTPLARGLWRDPDPLRVGLFAAALIQEWPIASTSSFTSMPLSGWFFLLLGWGLAEARWRPSLLPRPSSPISARPLRQTEISHG